MCQASEISFNMYLTPYLSIDCCSRKSTLHIIKYVNNATGNSNPQLSCCSNTNLFQCQYNKCYCVKHVTEYIFGFDVRGFFFFFFAITVVNNRRLIDFVQRLNNLCNLRRNVIVMF